jgi:hypothetical protein
VRGALAATGLVAAALLALAACAHAVGAAPGPAPSPAPELTRWIDDLDSARPSVYRIAAAYVAHAGPPALDALAARAPGADSTMRAHLGLAVGALLLTSVTPDELAKRPALTALGAAELASADRHAAALCASREYERDTGTPSDSTMGHHDRLVALRGWAVPAAVALTRCPTPTGRVFGLHLLVELKAGGQQAALAALGGDSTVVIAGEDEPQERTTIAALVASYGRDFPFSNHGAVIPGTVARSVGGEGEEYLAAVARQDGVDGPEYALINRMRDDAKTATAHSWDEFWQRARPLLEVLWDAPATSTPTNASSKEAPR